MNEQQFAEDLVRCAEIEAALEKLIPLFVFDGLCQQCGGKDGHEEWCLVGKAEDALE